ncbi:bifunctional DNA-formamidopyrimidine glycosylase/DNA-(apurinic or apyrimidinic site) lyase [Thiospirillum jenense]|uniref:Formamidopyrimidine-DNA glycosylase n=1 Tax=Thiospirillum jenense TaxID=1653858 RepID=A0A839HK78_9GAMM|nr:bifunctional DNA-formamidopyrimidine glycosylase/DNA-(apurinic or apyrimidinic site) lyase [Thiospirillum jenense]MBB1127276.1 bifunctional DNA-formamidopyrimidine glycosylase/DNA-(apurinic or apyrimidinic site) lyase [Thiospirillum jenense]
MPELPEVETTLRGLAPTVTGQRIVDVTVRERRFRYFITSATENAFKGQRILAIRRRAKYLLLDLEQGVGLIHLGMSGSLRIVTPATPAARHDHVDLALENCCCIRFHDPRRFGLLHWVVQPVEQHPLLRHLGIEPLAAEFNGAYLRQRATGRRVNIKNFIMDQRVVVGVGNIYASEALYRAGIHPACIVNALTRAQCDQLATAIRTVLTAAIAHGGTTLRDFVREDGRPGYFVHELQVYQRTGKPCYTCNTPICQQRLGQRSSFFCPVCQTLND